MFKKIHSQGTVIRELKEHMADKKQRHSPASQRLGTETVRSQLCSEAEDRRNALHGLQRGARGPGLQQSSAVNSALEINQVYLL